VRKFTIALLTTAIFAIAGFIPTKADAAADNRILNVAFVDQGMIGARYETANRLKLMVEAAGSKYTYDLNAQGKEEFFPLQAGDGTYTITLLENTTENKYRIVNKETVNVELNNPNAAFLNATQNVKWDATMGAIKKAKELTGKAKTDEEKVKAIYQYVIKNVQYDNDLMKNVKPGYLPDIERTFKTQKGICYDYAALFAAMLRSEGIPTKLVMGKTVNVKEYHAWNEVYLNGKWLIVDTTVDAGLLKANKTVSMIKLQADYTPELEY